MGIGKIDALSSVGVSPEHAAYGSYFCRNILFTATAALGHLSGPTRLKTGSSFAPWNRLLSVIMNEQEIKSALKTYILNEFLPGEDPAALTDSTPLMTTGILDSIAVLKAVTFLENQFGIVVQPHEAVVDNLNTLSDMARLVMSKKA